MEVGGRRYHEPEEGNAELEHLCEICDIENGANKADGICRECNEYMCITCFRQHRRVRLCRDHIMTEVDKTVVMVQESTVNVEKCKSHEEGTIRYYCRKHEIVGCGDCMIPVHGACKAENIQDLSKDFHRNDEFKSINKKLEDLKSANDENVKKVQVNRSANKLMLEKELTKLGRFRTQIIHYIQKAETLIRKEAEDIERENDKVLYDIEQDCKNLAAKITEVRQKLDTRLYQESALFIQTVNSKPDIIEIERAVSKVQVENVIKTIEFEPDKQIQSLIKSNQKLGTIFVKTDKLETKRKSRKGKAEGQKK